MAAGAIRPNDPAERRTAPRTGPASKASAMPILKPTVILVEELHRHDRVIAHPERRDVRLGVSPLQQLDAMISIEDAERRREQRRAFPPRPKT